MKAEQQVEEDAGARARILAAVLTVVLFAAMILLSLRPSLTGYTSAAMPSGPMAVITQSLASGTPVAGTQALNSSFVVSAPTRFFLEDSFGNTEVSSTEFLRAGRTPSEHLIDFRAPPIPIDLK